MYSLNKVIVMIQNRFCKAWCHDKNDPLVSRHNLRSFADHFIARGKYRYSTVCISWRILLPFSYFPNSTQIIFLNFLLITTKRWPGHRLHDKLTITTTRWPGQRLAGNAAKYPGSPAPQPPRGSIVIDNRRDWVIVDNQPNRHHTQTKQNNNIEHTGDVRRSWHAQTK